MVADADGAASPEEDDAVIAAPSPPPLRGAGRLTIREATPAAAATTVEAKAATRKAPLPLPSGWRPPDKSRAAAPADVSLYGGGAYRKEAPVRPERTTISYPFDGGGSGRANSRRREEVAVGRLDVQVMAPPPPRAFETPRHAVGKLTIHEAKAEDAAEVPTATFGGFPRLDDPIDEGSKTPWGDSESHAATVVTPDKETTSGEWEAILSTAEKPTPEHERLGERRDGGGGGGGVGDFKIPFESEEAASPAGTFAGAPRLIDPGARDGPRREREPPYSESSNGRIERREAPGGPTGRSGTERDGGGGGGGFPEPTGDEEGRGATSRGAGGGPEAEGAVALAGGAAFGAPTRLDFLNGGGEEPCKDIDVESISGHENPREEVPLITSGRAGNAMRQDLDEFREIFLGGTGAAKIPDPEGVYGPKTPSVHGGQVSDNNRRDGGGEGAPLLAPSGPSGSVAAAVAVAANSNQGSEAVGGAARTDRTDPSDAMGGAFLLAGVAPTSPDPNTVTQTDPPKEEDPPDGGHAWPFACTFPVQPLSSVGHQNGSEDVSGAATHANRTDPSDAKGDAFLFAGASSASLVGSNHCGTLDSDGAIRADPPNEEDPPDGGDARPFANTFPVPPRSSADLRDESVDAEGAARANRTDPSEAEGGAFLFAGAASMSLADSDNYGRPDPDSATGADPPNEEDPPDGRDASPFARARPRPFEPVDHRYGSEDVDGSASTRTDPIDAEAAFLFPPANSYYYRVGAFGSPAGGKDRKKRICLYLLLLLLLLLVVVLAVLLGQKSDEDGAAVAAFPGDVPTAPMLVTNETSSTMPNGEPNTHPSLMPSKECPVDTMAFSISHLHPVEDDSLVVTMRTTNNDNDAAVTWRIKNACTNEVVARCPPCSAGALDPDVLVQRHRPHKDVEGLLERRLHEEGPPEGLTDCLPIYNEYVLEVLPVENGAEACCGFDPTISRASYGGDVLGEAGGYLPNGATHFGERNAPCTSDVPSASPTVAGSKRPSPSPSQVYSDVPSKVQSPSPSASPTVAGSERPSSSPSRPLSEVPSTAPSYPPTTVPSTGPPSQSPVVHLGGCPDPFVPWSAYPVGARVESGGVVYECISTYCANYGFFPGAEGNSMWRHGWEVLGSCEGTVAPTGHPTAPVSLSGVWP